MNKQVIAKKTIISIWAVVLGATVFLSSAQAEPEVLVPVQDVQFQELPPPGFFEPVPELAHVKPQPAAANDTKKASGKAETQAVPAPARVQAKAPAVPAAEAKPAKASQPSASATTPLQTLIAQAKQGQRQAQYELGLRYQYGNGVSKTPSQAHYWLNKSAQAGYARAQYALSLFYQQYARNRPGLKKALLWLKKAADQGLADAQYSLGMMFRNGTLVHVNPAESRKWLQKAAAQGHELARLALQS